MNIINESKGCTQDSTPFNASFANVLVKLKESPLWCGYKNQPNQDPTKKPHKIPYSVVTGHNARVNDTATLTTYERLAVALSSGLCDGVNYAFGYDDAIGIDLDRIRLDTGAITCPKAAEIISRFKSAGAYIEASPSNTGIRIVCLGVFSRFGKGINGFNNFEIYGKGPCGLHFLSITGNAIQSVDEIPVCQDALDWLYQSYFKIPEVIYEKPEHGLIYSPALSDGEIIEKLRCSKLGVEFTSLYDTGSTGDHSSDDLKLCSMLAFYTQDSDQIDQIFIESALYRAKWDRTDYKVSTIDRALNGLTVTWQPRTVAALRYGTSEFEAARRFTDGETAADFKILRQAKQPQVNRYSKELGVWQRDYHSFELKRSVKEISKVVLSEIVNESDADFRTKLFKLAGKIETNRGLSDIVSLITGELSEFLPDLSNTKDNLLCVENGVLHLPKGNLWPHSEAHQFTLRSPVSYDKEAACPLWAKFINEFCCGDVELILFLQVWAGYCCSGYVNEQKMAVFFGYGQNGKSVFLEIMKFILGGFAATTPADTLLQRKSEQSNDIAALEHVRFVSAIEPDEGSALAEGRIKSLTGGDQVTCRKLFEEYRTFTPRFKLNLATNSKPRVNGTDFGIWRRLLLIPCKAEIQNPDKHLLEKLKREAPGILNWLVAGFQIWKKNGLTIPACILTATQDYKTESDTVGRFLDGVCNPYIDDIHHKDGIQSSLLYKGYTSWCLDEGHKPFSNIRFSQKMAEHGFPSSKFRAGMFYPVRLTLGGR